MTCTVVKDQYFRLPENLQYQFLQFPRIFLCIRARNMSMKAFRTIFFCTTFLCTTAISTAFDTINSSQSIIGSQTMVSADGTFQLAFFNRLNDGSDNRYLVISYREVTLSGLVWTANPVNPLPGTEGALKVTRNGIILTYSNNDTIVWSSKPSRSVHNPVAQLLNTGNLVVRDENDTDPKNFIWQSFDYPLSSLLPGAKLGRDRATGFERVLRSWKTVDDPSPGNFTIRLDPKGYPQVVLLQGAEIKYRAGPWNGLTFSGTPSLKAITALKYSFVLNDKEMYYSYEVLNKSFLARELVSFLGTFQHFNLDVQRRKWDMYLSAPADNCDNYALCGAHGSCNFGNSPFCGCLRGFVPKVPEEWDKSVWSTGCIRRTPFGCNGDGFWKHSDLKLPDTRKSWFNTTMSLEGCKIMCQKNCTCTAYANLDIRGNGSGCLLWFGDLIDIRQYNENGQDLYVRMSEPEPGKRNRKKGTAIIVSSVLGALLLCLALVMHILIKKRLSQANKEDLELPIYDLPKIAAATNNFSDENKLGEGGFGTVYKGILREGQEVAVKKLSRGSNQGVEEFKNEVKCIAKLQHRNLVKLIGCCIQEQMLIYEYMPNKSLDFFIFDQTNREQLNWQTRFHIIIGITRGLLYLHQDSRLRIVHRDLKASNILLDYDMNPKISDFGLAKSFGGNETEGRTKRVVGTYGYMSPEYAIDGVFSVKSDVFSYGVLVLEIVTGKRNRRFRHPDHYHNLLGHAWILFKEGRTIELMDDLIVESINLSEALRSIHVGLLCVQRHSEDRPNMSAVLMMLTSDTTLSEPKEPGFYMEREVLEAEALPSTQESCSGNEITISLSAR